MSVRHTGARLRAIIYHYKLKYPNATERLTAIQSDYQDAYARFAAGEADVIISSSAADQSATFAAGATAEEIIDAMVLACQHFERGGKASGWAQGRI